MAYLYTLIDQHYYFFIFMSFMMMIPGYQLCFLPKKSILSFNAWLGLLVGLASSYTLYQSLEIKTHLGLGLLSIGTGLLLFVLFSQVKSLGIFVMTMVTTSLFAFVCIGSAVGSAQASMPGAILWGLIAAIMSPFIQLHAASFLKSFIGSILLSLFFIVLFNNLLLYLVIFSLILIASCTLQVKTLHEQPLTLDIDDHDFQKYKDLHS